MKKTTLICTLILLPAVAFSQISKSVDEFTGEETLQTEFFELNIEDGSVMTSKAMFMYSDQYLFVFATLSDEWQHLMTSTAYFLIDDERRQFEVAHSENDTVDDRRNFRLTETNAFIFNTEDMLSISNASEVRFRFGDNIYRLPDSGITYAQKMLQEVGN